MPTYLRWDRITIDDFSDKHIEKKYNNGFVFTRVDKGIMDQTRSVRIDLEKFQLSSENRRILRKTDGLTLEATPLPYPDYHWSIHKMGKDFYSNKFGTGTFSANKIKELFTDEEKSNFNMALTYRLEEIAVGYCISRETAHMLHYCYPFYDLNTEMKNLGMGMMLNAIIYAQKTGKKYIYLGSAQRPADTYKLQFTGLEWFDGNHWQTDITKLKQLLKQV